MAMLMLSACAASFCVRPLSVFDFAATAPLLADSFEPTAVGPLQRPAAIFKQSVGLQKRLGATTQLVACDRTDAVCGYVELWNSEFLEGRSIRGWHHEPPDAYVSSLAVATSHRRRGVATALMQAAEEQYLSEGRESISLQVEVANQPAVSLYESLGYKTIGRDERAVYGGIQFEARLALRKQLSQATSSSSSTPATMADPPRPRASSARRVSGFTMQLGAEELSADELEVALLTEERLLLDVWAEWCEARALTQCTPLSSLYLCTLLTVYCALCVVHRHGRAPRAHPAAAPAGGLRARPGHGGGRLRRPLLRRGAPGLRGEGHVRDAPHAQEAARRCVGRSAADARGDRSE